MSNVVKPRSTSLYPVKADNARMVDRERLAQMLHKSADLRELISLFEQLPPTEKTLILRIARCLSGAMTSRQRGRLLIDVRRSRFPVAPELEALIVNARTLTEAA